MVEKKDFFLLLSKDIGGGINRIDAAACLNGGNFTPPAGITGIEIAEGAQTPFVVFERVWAPFAIFGKCDSVYISQLLAKWGPNPDMVHRLSRRYFLQDGQGPSWLWRFCCRLGRTSVNPDCA